MLTVAKKQEKTIEIKKSKFIGILLPFEEEKELSILLDEVKEKYPNATHYCFAYRTSFSEKASDDKEPSKTAGFPILNVLKKQNLEQILCVVVRYFGGIKLGAGGLVRAYTTITKEVIDLAKEEENIVEMLPAYLVKLTCSYQEQKQIEYHLAKEQIQDVSFQEEVTYTFLWEKEKELPFQNYQIIKECSMRKRR